MTDSHLRELERRFKESGSVEDEVAYLLERVRLGELDRDMLELAAYCGHQASCQALGDQVPRMPEKLKAWVEGLQVWNKETCVRAVIAVAQTCISIWAKRYPEENRPQRAIASAIAWAMCPCEGHERAARTARDAAVEARAAGLTEAVETDPELSSWDEGVEARAADAAAGAAAWAALAAGSTSAAVAAGVAAVEVDAYAALANQVKQAICNDLIPWALGYDDPLIKIAEALEGTD